MAILDRRVEREFGIVVIGWVDGGQETGSGGRFQDGVWSYAGGSRQRDLQQADGPVHLSLVDGIHIRVL